MNIKDYKKLYRETHKQEIAEYKKSYRELHKQEIADYAKDYYHKHKEERCKYARSRYEKIKNTETFKQQRNKRARQNKNINDKLRVHIYKSIKRGHGTKNIPTEEILGCSIDFFKEYIASLFTEGMT